MTTYSYTDLQTLGRCPQKFKYRQVVRIQPRRKQTALFQGQAIHRMVMAGYLTLREVGGNLEDAVYGEHADLWDEASRYLFSDESLDLKQMLDESADIVMRYFRRYADEEDGWEVLHAEEQFSIEIETDDGRVFVITVTPDLVIRDRNGFVWILDHKSTQSLPTGMPFTDLQAAVYVLAVQAVYPGTVGFLFNYLRKKTPTEPRLNKTKKDGLYWVNDLNRVDTTFEILRDFIAAEAPHLFDHPEHKARLAELRDRDTFFSREQVHVGPQQLEAVAEDLANQARMAELLEAHGLYYRVYEKTGVSSCERCGYRSICQAELLGGDTERVLREEYEERDDSHKEYELADEESA